MKTNLSNHYKNVIIYDLLTKLNFKNIYNTNKINKICLNIGFKNSNIEKKKLTNIIVLLKLITNQEPLVTKSKKNNLIFKIKKNSIIGCKVTLRNQNLFLFLEKLTFFILPNTQKFTMTGNNQNIFNFQVKNILNFFELETEFLKFKNIPPIDIAIHTNAQNHKELYLLLNSYTTFFK